MRYLATPPSPDRRAAYTEAGLGVMLTPAMWRRAPEEVAGWPYWAADNGCFSDPDGFDLERYLEWLERLEPARLSCLFATAPDVLGDPVETARRARPVLPRLRAAGWPAALVAQDGLEPAAVPWDELDVLFIGGTTAWKRSEPSFALVRAAVAAGRAAHVGRVNSVQALRAFSAVGASSADGTCIGFGPDKHLPLFARGVRLARNEPGMVL